VTVPHESTYRDDDVAAARPPERAYGEGEAAAPPPPPVFRQDGNDRRQRIGRRLGMIALVCGIAAAALTIIGQFLVDAEELRAAMEQASNQPATFPATQMSEQEMQEQVRKQLEPLMTVWENNAPGITSICSGMILSLAALLLGLIGLIMTPRGNVPAWLSLVFVLVSCCGGCVG
jgi:hypothetical protein